MIDRRAVILLALAGAAGPGLAEAASPLADQPPLPAPLQTFDAISVKTAKGETSTLRQQLGKPRPTIVSFWATWCAPCALEGQHLGKIRERYPDEALAIIGINIDSNPVETKVAAFRAKAKMNYAQGANGQQLYLAMGTTDRIALPRTYVFDRDGRAVAAFGRFFGARTLAAIDASVAQAIR